MAKMTVATPTFGDLVKLSSDFVTKQKGVWDHSAWLDFISNVQKKGFNISDMESNLGEAIEAMKRFYTATASTQGIEKAMTNLAMDSAEFISKQKGVWGHEEWEAFVNSVKQNTFDLSEEAMAYLGGVLESMKVFYFLSPPPAKKVPAESTSKVKAKPAARKAKAKPAARKVEAKTTAPEAKPKSSGGTTESKDDLTAISGIGPALQKKLNAEGFCSYAQIAALSEKEIQRLEETIIKFPGRIKRDNWVEQARKLQK